MTLGDDADADADVRGQMGLAISGRTRSMLIRTSNS